MIQIDFYDASVIDSLVPIKSMKPDAVCFFIDRQYHRRFDDPEFMRNAILRWGYVKQVLFVDVDIRNYQEIKSKINYLIRTTDHDEVTIDLTGGNELLIAAGFEFHNRDKVKVILTDIDNEIIYDVATNETIAKAEHITLQDYVSAIGALRLQESREQPEDNAFGRIRNVFETMQDHLGEWHALSDFLSHNYDRETLDIYIPAKLTHNNKTYSMDEVLPCLCFYGYIRKKSGRRFLFRDLTSKRYMINYGVWLELYVYSKLRAVFDEVYLGVQLDWDRSDTYTTADNEIDVIAIHKSVPIFVSCKMRPLKVNDLYEVGCLARKFGGRHARALIVTTDFVESMNRNRQVILHKCEVLNVGLVTSHMLSESDYGESLLRLVNML